MRRVHCSAETSGTATGDDAALGESHKTTALQYGYVLCSLPLCTTTTAQTLYEYLYRAISDYVDLYRNKDEEYEYSVPVGAANNGTTKVTKVNLKHNKMANLCILCFAFQSAKSIQSTKSLKSNGSGPYCLPVGTTGSNSSAS